jgi:anti-anti-sigma factor
MALDIAPPQFTCEVIPARDTIVLALSGELDLATTPRVWRKLEELVPGGFGKVLIDLSALTFIDSTGLRLLVAASKLAQEHGSSFAIVPGGPAVQRALALTGLDTAFAIEDGAL